MASAAEAFCSTSSTGAPAVLGQQLSQERIRQYGRQPQARLFRRLLDVLQSRLKVGHGVPAGFDATRWSALRWIGGDRALGGDEPIRHGGGP